MLDELGLIATCCDACAHMWISTTVANPLANWVNVNDELLGRYDELMERIGHFLVGDYDRDVEYKLFDLLLFAEPGMYLKTGDGLGSSLSTEFVLKLQQGAKPVCHDLRRMSKVKNEFVD